MVEIRTDRENGTIRVQILIEGPSKTEQSHKGSTNINKIIAKYRKTGFMRQKANLPTYGDFTQSTDYHDIKNRLIKADDDFMSLPSEIRNKFDNDPGELLDFINNPENAQECVLMGLMQKMAPDILEEPENPLEAEPEAKKEASEETIFDKNE